MLLACAKELGLEMREGVYSAVGGPSYETISDARFLLQAGADCVGMSTAHETTVASYCGLKVVALSIITDLVPLDWDHDEEGSNHEEVVKVANKRAKDAEKLVELFFKKMSADTEV